MLHDQQSEGLENKTIVVTGAGRGQGLAEVNLLARRGARVLACDVRDGPARVPEPESIEYLRLDVSVSDDWLYLREKIDQDYRGRVDGLVNNAGVVSRDSLDVVTVDEWTRVQQINALGPLLGLQTLCSAMPSGAAVVNVGSTAARSGHYAVAYTMSKWALRGLSAVAAMELGQQGIRVNTVHPGFVETPMTQSASKAFRSATIDQVPLGRSGLAEDIAQLVAFLLSDRSSYINGAEVEIDGGQVSQGGNLNISRILANAAAQP